jgi:hypothetical protein
VAEGVGEMVVAQVGVAAQVVVAAAALVAVAAVVETEMEVVAKETEVVREAVGLVGVPVEDLVEERVGEDEEEVLVAAKAGAEVKMYPQLESGRS